jgi:polysaccharide biosynthesis transport protein
MIPLKQPKLGLPVAAAPLCAPNWQQVEAGPPLFECHQTLVVSLRELLEESGKTSLVVGITSCESGEGVSTVAMHLAKAAAQMLDLEVVLLDAHGSRPSLDLTVGISRSPGLSDYLNGTALLSDCLCSTRLERLTVLPAGAPDVGVPGDQDWNGVRALFDELRREFGWVVVDLPPVAEFGGWLSMASHLDGVLLIVAAERVSGPAARRAADRLRHVGAHLVGAVLNGCQSYLPQWLESRL